MKTSNATTRQFVIEQKSLFEFELKEKTTKGNVKVDTHCFRLALVKKIEEMGGILCKS